MATRKWKIIGLIFGVVIVIAMVMTAYLLNITTQSHDLKIKSADEQVEIIFPKTALADDRDFQDVKIETVAAEDLPVHLPNVVAAYQLLPDGAVFKETAYLTLKIPYTSTVLPEFHLISSEGLIEPLDDFEMILDLDTQTLIAQGPIAHFSTFVSSLSHFQINISDPTTYKVGESFDVNVGVNAVHPEFTFDIPGKGTGRYKLVGDYILEGSLFTGSAGTPIVSPAFVEVLPEFRIIPAAENYNDVVKFSCVKAGTDKLKYKIKIQYQHTISVDNVMESMVLWAGDLISGDQPITLHEKSFVYSKAFHCVEDNKLPNASTSNSNQPTMYTNTNSEVTVPTMNNSVIHKVPKIKTEAEHYISEHNLSVIAFSLTPLDTASSELKKLVVVLESPLSSPYSYNTNINLSGTEGWTCDTNNKTLPPLFECSGGTALAMRKKSVFTFFLPQRLSDVPNSFEIQVPYTEGILTVPIELRDTSEK